MGTIENITAALHKIKEDKKYQLTARFLDHSKWLEDEFMALQQLIQRDTKQAQNDSNNALQRTAQENTETFEKYTGSNWKKDIQPVDEGETSESSQRQKRKDRKSVV